VKIWRAARRTTCEKRKRKNQLCGKRGKKKGKGGESGQLFDCSFSRKTITWPTKGGQGREGTKSEETNCRLVNHYPTQQKERKAREKPARKGGEGKRKGRGGGINLLLHSREEKKKKKSLIAVPKKRRGREERKGDLLFNFIRRS